MLARVQGGDVGCPDVVNVREFLFRQFSLSSRRRRISSSVVMGCPSLRESTQLPLLLLLFFLCVVLLEGVSVLSA